MDFHMPDFLLSFFSGSVIPVHSSTVTFVSSEEQHHSRTSKSIVSSYPLPSDLEK